MFARTLIVTTLALAGLVFFGCSDNSTNPSSLYFSGITKTNGNGVITSFDPDDWCYGEIVMTDELVHFAPTAWLYATQVGDTGRAWIQLFNYSERELTIQLDSPDSTIGFQARSVTISPESWGEIPVLYIPVSADTRTGELALPVSPFADTLYMPYEAYVGVVPLYPIALPLGFFNPYPNPCMHATTLRFSTPEAAHVKLTIRGPDNFLGGSDVLLDENLPAGWHQIEWAISDDTEPGVYRAYIEIDDFECYGDIEVIEDPIVWEP